MAKEVTRAQTPSAAPKPQPGGTPSTGAVDETEQGGRREGQQQADATAVATGNTDNAAAVEATRKETAERQNANQPPKPAGRGSEPEVKRAGGRETSGGGLRLVNRNVNAVRIVVENQTDGEWTRESVVNLQTDDTTEIILEGGRRVVVDMV